MSTKSEKEKIKKPITTDDEIVEEENKSIILLVIGILLVILLIIGVISYLNYKDKEKSNNNSNNKDNQKEVIDKEDDEQEEENQVTDNSVNTYVPTTKVNNPVSVTKYTVEYYNGEVLISKIEVENGKNITSLTLEGLEDTQVVKYWYYIDDEGNEVIFDFESDTVTSNLKLYAKIVSYYEVQFLNYNEEEVIISRMIESGKLIGDLEIPEDKLVRTAENGYEKFTGWYLDGEEFDFSTPITDNLTLYAKYERAFQVRFYIEYLENEEDYETYEGEHIDEYVLENEVAIAPLDVEYETMKVKSWWILDESKDMYDFELPVTKDLILVPIFGYVLTYDSRGGNEIDPVILVEGETISSELNVIPTKEGYKFERWTYEDGEEIDFGSDAMPDEHLTIYAKWTAAVTFESNGGTEVAPVVPDEEGYINSPEAPTREGYDFAGWYYDKELTLPVDLDSTFEVPEILYAKWQEISYKVTYDPNGALRFDGEDKVEEETVIPGESIEIANLYDVYENPGHSLMGWSFTSTGGVDLEIDQVYTPTGNITLYAVWGEF